MNSTFWYTQVILKSPAMFVTFFWKMYQIIDYAAQCIIALFILVLIHKNRLQCESDIKNLCRYDLVKYAQTFSNNITRAVND